MASLASTFDAADISAPGHYGPSQTALLLLDFHSLFVEKAGGPQARAALDVAANMRAWAKSQGIQVIHALVDANATPFPTYKTSPRISGFLAALKSSDGEESAKLLEGGGDITFTRRPGHVSALKSTGMDDFLQNKGIKSLVLSGLSTSGCVMGTALAASDAEYVVTVISDGCADPGDGVHDMVLGKLLNRGYPITATEFQEGFANLTRAT